MFIKWRETNRPLSPQRSAELSALRPSWATGKRASVTPRFYAYLAKSVRVEGKPRQKIITYLASIPAHCMQDDEGAEWRAFWFKVYYELALVRAPIKVYWHVLDELEKRVHAPTREELARLAFEEWEFYPKWRKDYDAINRALEWASSAWALG